MASHTDMDNDSSSDDGGVLIPGDLENLDNDDTTSSDGSEQGGVNISVGDYDEAADISTAGKLIDLVERDSTFEAKWKSEVENNANRMTNIRIARERATPDKRKATLDFYIAWEDMLIHEDNCFLYTDEKSAAIFTSRMGGKSPADFARKAINSGSKALRWAKSQNGGEKQIIPAMLAFWQDRSKVWRTQFSSKQQAREDWKQRKQHLSLMPKLFERCVNWTPNGYLSLGVGKVQFGEKGHIRTVYVEPMLDKSGQLMYLTRGITHCHPKCNKKIPEKVLRNATEEREKQDLQLLHAAWALETRG